MANGVKVKNYYDLFTKVTPLIEKIIDEVAKKVLKDLRKQIMEDVYTYDYYPNNWYAYGKKRPTFQFLRAWEWGEFMRHSKGIFKVLSMNPYSMTYGNWVHGSKIKGWSDDARQYMDAILNEVDKGDGYRTSSLMMGGVYFSKKRRPYWTNFLEMMMNGKLKKYFDEEFAKHGLKIRHE